MLLWLIWLADGSDPKIFGHKLCFIFIRKFRIYNIWANVFDMGSATSSAFGCFSLFLCTQPAMKWLKKKKSHLAWIIAVQWRENILRNEMSNYCCISYFVGMLHSCLICCIWYMFLISACMNNFSFLSAFQILPLNNQ